MVLLVQWFSGVPFLIQFRERDRGLAGLVVVICLSLGGFHFVYFNCVWYSLCILCWLDEAQVSSICAAASGALACAYV